MTSISFDAGQPLHELAADGAAARTNRYRLLRIEPPLQVEAR